MSWADDMKAKLETVDLSVESETEEEIHLLPCPFCGGEAELLMDFDGVEEGIYTVECQMCWATTAIYLDEEDAINAWNRRTK